MMEIESSPFRAISRQRSALRSSAASAALAGALLAAGCSDGSDGSAGGSASSQGMPPEAIQFGLRVDRSFATGHVASIALRDLNGDGRMDYAEADDAGRAVTIVMGDADGDFTALRVLGTSAIPRSVAFEDFDLDGRDDLVVACGSPFDAATPELMLFLQDASGDFALAGTLTLPTSPLGVRTGTIDGEPSALVPLYESGEIWRVVLSGPGVLTQADVFSTATIGGEEAVSVAVVDVGGDGLVDVVGSDVAQVFVFSNDGAGGFTDPTVVLGPINAPFLVSAGDLDQNGYEDLGVAQLGQPGARVLLGDAAGFSTVTPIPFAFETSSLAFEDFDGDGLVDVAATCFLEGAVAVRHADAPLDWAAAPSTYYNVGSASHSLHALRLPGDAAPDLLCVNASDVSFLSNDGAGGFEAARGTQVGEQPQHVVTADLDQDGFLDAVTIDLYQRNLVFLKGGPDRSLTNVGEIRLEPSMTETPGHVALVDCDGDGWLDVLTTVYDTGEVQLFRNPGSLPFPEPAPEDRVDVGDLPIGIAAADMDEDGEMDVVVANSGDRSLQVCLGGPDGLEPQPAMPIPMRPLALIARDIDGDGHHDVAATTGEIDGTDPRIVTFQGDGAGGLAIKSQISVGALSAVLRTADLDSDGRIDLVASQSGVTTDQVFVLLNRGGFGLDEDAVLVGEDPGTVEIADVDLDGDVDLIVPLGAGALRVALGDGAGGFPTIVPEEADGMPVPFGTSSSAFSDLDDDGLPELLLTSPYSSLLWVARNRSGE